MSAWLIAGGGARGCALAAAGAEGWQKLRQRVLPEAARTKRSSVAYNAIQGVGNVGGWAKEALVGRKERSIQKVLHEQLLDRSILLETRASRAVVSAPSHIWYGKFILHERWRLVLLLLLMAYFLLISIFAGLLLIGGDCIMDSRTDGPTQRYEDAFYLSLQTFTSVGYGSLIPTTKYANIVVAFESFASIVYIALAGGGIFMKMLHPIPQVMIADKVVIYDEIVGSASRKVLAIRVVLGKGYKLFNTLATLELQFPVRDRIGGSVIGSNVELLKLEHSEYACHLSMSTYIHVIDQSSPLYGADAVVLPVVMQSLFFLLRGNDAMSFNTVQAGRFWVPEDVHHDHKFVQIFTNKAKEQRKGVKRALTSLRGSVSNVMSAASPGAQARLEERAIEADKVHDIEPLATTPWSGVQPRAQRGSSAVLSKTELSELARRVTDELAEQCDAAEAEVSPARTAASLEHWLTRNPRRLAAHFN